MRNIVQSMIEDNYDFSDRTPGLEFSCGSIELDFLSEAKKSGEFNIINTSDTPMEGYIYVTGSRMYLTSDYFKGMESVCSFTFDSTGMAEGDEIEGEFQIVSNKGEYVIPYKAHMSGSYIDSTKGEIRNLFHFANLAADNFDEAVTVFYSPEFINLLKGPDARYLGMYRALSSRRYNEQYVDEFLVGIRKKSRVSLSASVSKINLNTVMDTKGEFKIYASTYGATGFKVYADDLQIVTEKTEYHINDYEDRECVVRYEINKEALHTGFNYLNIHVEHYNGDIIIPVVINNKAIDITSTSEYYTKKIIMDIERAYVLYEIGKIELGDFAKKITNYAVMLRGDKISELWSALLKIQVLIAEDRVKDARYSLEKVGPEIDSFKAGEEIYAYYLYLTAMADRSTSYVDKAAHKVKKVYHRNKDNTIIAYVHMFLQEEYAVKKDKKYEFIKEEYYLGVSSPLFLAQALNLAKANPALVTELGDFERSLVRFALKYDAIDERIAERIDFLANRDRTFDRTIYNALVYIYNKNPNKMALSSICSYLMKGNKVGREDFRWYEKAVEEDIRLTRLYEFYMYSLPMDENIELKQIIMMYFTYKNSLGYEKQSYLIRKVMDNKDKYPDIALNFLEGIERFLKDQLNEGHINSSLARLYRDYITTNMINEDNIERAVPLIFMHEIEVTNPKASMVIIIHGKASKEFQARIIDGKAYLPIYSRDYCIVLEDDRHNRYVDNEHIKVKKVIDDEQLITYVRSFDTKGMGPCIYFSEEGNNDDAIDEQNLVYYERLYDSDRVVKSYHDELMVKLIKYYHSIDDIKNLDELLADPDMSVISPSDRGDLIQIMVSLGMYDEAFKYVCEYGPYHVEDKTILRLCSRLLERRDFDEDPYLVDLSGYIYRRDKYDQNILTYLVKNMDGTTADLRVLYEVSKEFQVETFPLLEKILMQFLFSGIYSSSKMLYFEEYVHLNGSADLQKAFLASSAYEYFVKEGMINDDIFAHIEGFLADGEDMPRVCKLALLQFLSDKDKTLLNEELVTRLIEEEIRNDRCFPFFMEYISMVPGLLRFTDRAFVQYKGDNRSRVIIHYSIEREADKENEYHRDEMVNLYGGIFVSDFILFSDEAIQYYITEELNNKEMLTQSSVLRQKDDAASGISWRYSLLNEAEIARKMNDYTYSEEMLKEYIKKDYLTRMIFK